MVHLSLWRIRMQKQMILGVLTHSNRSLLAGFLKKTRNLLGIHHRESHIVCLLSLLEVRKVDVTDLILQQRHHYCRLRRRLGGTWLPNQQLQIQLPVYQKYFQLVMLQNRSLRCLHVKILSNQFSQKWVEAIQILSLQNQKPLLWMIKLWVLTIVLTT
uniref:Uncharacterized protein n=1 Tax=Opuntia streptacantha TaxID=393608 RepID=A0A7C9EM07_OPUST